MNETPKSQQLVSSLIEKFQNCTGLPTLLEISPSELVQAVSILAKENDPKRLCTLFDAYLGWELEPYAGTEETVEQITARSLRNFDTICQLADNLQTAIGNKIVAENLNVYGDQTQIGSIRRFYRQAIGREIPPLNPNSGK